MTDDRETTVSDRTFTTDDRGVSETIGYVLIFGIVVIILSTVFITGIAGLETSQAHEQDRNMERAFDVMADNLDDVQSGDAPSRATEVRLGEGSLGLQSASQIRVNDTSDPNASTSMGPQPIVHMDGDSEVVYEAGALFRVEGDNVRMIREPRWVVTDDVLVVPFIWTQPVDTRRSVSGPGTFLVVGEQTESSSVTRYGHTDPDTFTVTIEITSPYVEGWEGYLQESGFTEVETVDGYIKYEAEFRQVNVHHTSVLVGVQN